MPRFDDAAKRAINLSLNAKVLDAARELGLNISQTVEALLATEVRRLREERWATRNHEAVAAYNQRIERDGTCSQQLQQYLATEASEHSV